MWWLDWGDFWARVCYTVLCALVCVSNSAECTSVRARYNMCCLLFAACVARATLRPTLQCTMSCLPLHPVLCTVRCTVYPVRCILIGGQRNKDLSPLLLIFCILQLHLMQSTLFSLTNYKVIKGFKCYQIHWQWKGCLKYSYSVL